jgi:hypothetical protein
MYIVTALRFLALRPALQRVVQVPFKTLQAAGTLPQPRPVRQAVGLTLGHLARGVVKLAHEPVSQQTALVLFKQHPGPVARQDAEAGLRIAHVPPEDKAEPAHAQGQTAAPIASPKVDAVP